MASGSPRCDKLAKDAYSDNLVYLKNTNCSTLDCLLGLSCQQATGAIPWDIFPNWNMYDQYDPPYKLTQFDGSMAIVDGEFTNEPANQIKYSISWSSLFLEMNCQHQERLNLIFMKTLQVILSLLYQMILVTRKSVFGVSDQLRLKPACAATEAR